MGAEEMEVEAGMGAVVDLREGEGETARAVLETVGTMVMEGDWARAT